MQQACKIIKEIPQETILGLLKNPLARHAIAKKVIKLVKKGTISLELVLASKSKLKQVTKQASKQQTKASGSVWKQLSFSSPAIEMRSEDDRYDGDLTEEFGDLAAHFGGFEASRRSFTRHRKKASTMRWHSSRIAV